MGDEHIRLPRVPGSAAMARAFVAGVAGESLSATDRDTLLLLTSELVTNAIRFGGSDDLVVHVRPYGTNLRVEVEDTSEDLPQQRSADDLDEHGRGLHIVAALAHDWGAHMVNSAQGVRKVVWFMVGGLAVA